MMVRSAVYCVFAFVLALFATGCEVANPEFEAASPRVEESTSGAEAGLLMLLNDPTTTYAVLDDEAGIDARAASNIITHRNGFDGMYGTDDDQLFGSMREVDEIERVGPVTLEQLVAFAFEQGYMAQ